MLWEALTNDDRNEIKHERVGLVSTRKGGGVFECSVAPTANAKLDKSNIAFGGARRAQFCV